MKRPPRLPSAAMALLLSALALAALAQTVAPPPAALAPATTADKTLAPTVVTLVRKDVIPEDAFTVLAKSAGVRFAAPETLWDSDTLMRSISIDATAKPFWAVVTELCDKSDLVPIANIYSLGSRGPDSRRIGLAINKSGAPFGKRPTAVAGPFLVTIDRLVRTTATQYARLENTAVRPAAPDALGLSMTVFCEPRLRVTDAPSIRIDQLLAEDGSSLLRPNIAAPEARTNYPGYYREGARPILWQTQFNLMVPPAAGRKLAAVKATMPVTIATRNASWEVMELGFARGNTREIEQCACTFRELAPVPNRPGAYAVTLSFKPPASGLFGDLFQLCTQAQLVDETGVPYLVERGGGEAVLPPAEPGVPRDGTIGYKIIFVPDSRAGVKVPGAPAKFILEYPTETKRYDVPIVFENVPLP